MFVITSVSCVVNTTQVQLRDRPINHASLCACPPPSSCDRLSLWLSLHEANGPRVLPVTAISLIWVVRSGAVVLAVVILRPFVRLVLLRCRRDLRDDGRRTTDVKKIVTVVSLFTLLALAVFACRPEACAAPKSELSSEVSREQ